MATRRQRIIQAIVDRLVAANTTAADRIYRGRVRFSEDDDFPAISILPGDSEQTDRAGDRDKIELPIEVQALALANLVNPGDAIETLIGEIKAAVFDPNDRRLGGEVMDMYYTGDGGIDREEGGSYVSASVNFVVEYVEHYGNPTQ